MIPSSREKVLDAIRKSLADEPKLGPAPIPVPLYERAEEDILLEFANNFTSLDCAFFYCDSDEVAEQLFKFLKAKEFQHIYAWEAPVVDFLQQIDIPCITNENNLQEIDASITMCEALVARTGSIVVSSAQKAGRRLTIYPPHHIVIALASQVMSDIKDALAYMKQRYPDGLPSMISFISGASRTADIEKTLVKGAHGPKELTLFLVDDLSNHEED